MSSEKNRVPNMGEKCSLKKQGLWDSVVFIYISANYGVCRLIIITRTTITKNVTNVERMITWIVTSTKHKEERALYFPV